MNTDDVREIKYFNINKYSIVRQEKCRVHLIASDNKVISMDLKNPITVMFSEIKDIKNGESN